ncbi:MAG: PAS domain S-box protein [Chitinophagaceae bacterium]|nr:PAS domain S-box protein [Chitinophagaceae bacterium]
MTTTLAILLVEDNPGDELLIKEQLHLTPLTIRQIFTASSIADAEKILEQEQVDVVLLDLTLPDSNGLDSFLAISRFASLPVIILSGLGIEKMALQSITLGAQDFLQKGEFDEKMLDKTIRYSIERKKNLEDLRISNERYSIVSKVTNDMMWDWDIVGNTVFRSEEQFVRQFKYPAEKKDLNQDFWLSIVHPDDLKIFDRIKKEMQENSSVNMFTEEYRILDGEGNYRFVNDRGYLIRDETGKVLRMIGATLDITDKRNAEQELRKLSLIAEKTVNAVIITDTDENIQWVNDAFEHLSGYHLEEIKGKKPGSVMQGPLTGKEQKQYLRKQINNRDAFSCEILNYHKSGSSYWILLQGQPVFDDEGNLLYYFAMQTDITERKKTDEILQLSEEKYRTLFNTMPASIFVWGLNDLKILEVNQKAVKQYGYCKKDFLQLTALDLRLPEDQHKFIDLAKTALLNNHFSSNGVWKHLNKNGEIMYMQISSNRIDYNGQPAMMAIATDITDKIILEQKLEEEKTKNENEVAQATITAQEKAQQEIGRELHDNVNQVLASSKLFMGLLRNNRGVHDTYLNEAEALLTLAINEIRDLSHILIAPGIQGSEFSKALDGLLKHTVGAAGLEVEKEVNDFFTDGMEEQMQLTIYRMVQEQLNNILKHAKATRVWLTLTRKANIVYLSIKDNGKGFNSTDISDGVGFLNLKNRASLYQGEVKIYSSEGNGCEVLATFKMK